MLAALSTYGPGQQHTAATSSHHLLNGLILLPHFCREVVIMLAALSTCDPGDVNAAIKAAKQQRVRVSGESVRSRGAPAHLLHTCCTCVP